MDAEGRYCPIFLAQRINDIVLSQLVSSLSDQSLSAGRLASPAADGRPPGSGPLTAVQAQSELLRALQRMQLLQAPIGLQAEVIQD